MPLLIMLLCLLLAGCETLSYYSQAVKGQLSLMHNKTSVDKLLKEDNTPANLRERLELTQRVLLFADNQLAMKPGNAFSAYVDTGRDYVVWNVVAAPEFSLTPLEWCFPVAGCVAYRGYFSKDDAVKKAKALKKQGYDVHVGGIRAYSTLGWFNDPLLNTFIYDEKSDFVGLLIHELAHKVLYVKGDTTFNESFATAVELMGVKQFAAAGLLGQSHSKSLLAVEQSKAFNDFLVGYLPKLKSLYSNQALLQADKKKEKQAILEGILQAYDELKAKAGWGDRYRSWVASLNNAKLATVGNYNEYVRAFIALRQSVKSDKAFYQQAKALGQLPKDERYKQLDLWQGKFEL